MHAGAAACRQDGAVRSQPVRPVSRAQPPAQGGRQRPGRGRQGAGDDHGANQGGKSTFLPSIGLAQLVQAMLDSGIKGMFVTHFYDLAHGFYAEEPAGGALFLRAERAADGARTFRLK